MNRHKPQRRARSALFGPCHFALGFDAFCQFNHAGVDTRQQNSAVTARLQQALPRGTPAFRVSEHLNENNVTGRPGAAQPEPPERPPGPTPSRWTCSAAAPLEQINKTTILNSKRAVANEDRRRERLQCGPVRTHASSRGFRKIERSLYRLNSQRRRTAATDLFTWKSLSFFRL